MFLIFIEPYFAKGVGDVRPRGIPVGFDWWVLYDAHHKNFSNEVEKFWYSGLFLQPAANSGFTRDGIRVSVLLASKQLWFMFHNLLQLVDWVTNCEKYANGDLSAWLVTRPGWRVYVGHSTRPITSSYRRNINLHIITSTIHIIQHLFISSSPAFVSLTDALWTLNTSLFLLVNPHQCVTSSK